MKKFFVMLLMAAGTAVTSAQVKFAHFNMADVLTNLPEYKTASDDIQKLSAQFQEELTRLQTEFRTKGEELQKLAQDGKTAEAILQSKSQELQKMEESIQQFYQASQQELQSKQAEKMEGIQVKIMAQIQKIAETGGYVYVMDSSNAAVGGPVVFVNNALSTDITAQVKTALGIQ